MKKKSCFTLIELLVVVAIILILTGLLLPGLAKSREKAKFIRWVAIRESIKKEPSCAAYYVFNDDYKTSDNKFKNLATFTDAGSYNKNFNPDNTKMTVNNGSVSKQYGRFQNYSGLDVGGNGYGLADYINAFDITDQVTVEAWFKPNANANCVGVLAGKAYNCSNTCYALMYDGDSDGTNSIWARMRDENGTTRSYYASSASIHATAGKWHHGAFTYDGTDITFYLDGQKLSSTDCFAGKKFYDDDNTSTVSIGAFNNDDWSFGNSPSGYISEAAIYARALTHSEIKAHYEGGKNE